VAQRRRPVLTCWTCSPSCGTAWPGPNVSRLMVLNRGVIQIKYHQFGNFLLSTSFQSLQVLPSLQVPRSQPGKSGIQAAFLLYLVTHLHPDPGAHPSAPSGCQHIGFWRLMEEGDEHELDTWLGCHLSSDLWFLHIPNTQACNCPDGLSNQPF
jgi:hypothetical protein